MDGRATIRYQSIDGNFNITGSLYICFLFDLLNLTAVIEERKIKRERAK